MTLKTSAPWHRASWDRFVQDLLPQLLDDRLPLAGYLVEAEDTYTCRLKVILQGRDGELELDYSGIPQPDEQGMFKIGGQYKVVVPVPSEVDLAAAEIRCVGELLADFLAQRLGKSSEPVAWDTALAREWLPLDGWILEFLTGDPTCQHLQQTNWLDMYTHLRRITLIPTIGRASDTRHAFHPSQVGRTCLFCTPEGPNIARILEVAQGAEIRNGKLEIVDDRPQDRLGLAASCVPFLEHDDTNRLLMGVNMMRQWIGAVSPELPRDETGHWHAYHTQFKADAEPEGEPALVQTGREPEDPHFWTGYNLLTAFMTWDGNGLEDALVISQSCAARMQAPQPVEVGDKFSNRHGTKGVVSQILPDEKMPHLPDGTPVELIYSLSNLPSRMTIGQVRESVMGRIAQAEGQPALVPPFEAPSAQELKARLKKAGLPESGMELLRVEGKALSRPSAVGWVYWGRTLHLASDKLHFAVAPGERGQMIGETECFALRESKANEVIRELIGTTAARRQDKLAERIAAGPVQAADPPAPGFAELKARLAAGGIGVDFSDAGLTFDFVAPQGVDLAQKVSHPWLPGRTLAKVGRYGDGPEYDALVEANKRLTRMLETGAPEPLTQKCRNLLESRVKAYMDALVMPQHLCFDERVLFSGRSVITCGTDLRHDQVGLPQDMAWALFGPMTARELGDRAAVEKRSTTAQEKLQEVMAQSWVIFYRAPALSSTAFLAFHPVQHSGKAIRFCPLGCQLANADFDGDQAAIYLPVTDAAQQEAATQLSIAGHLRRNPALIKEVAPTHDALWGLASMGLSEEGLEEIERVAGRKVAHGRIVDKQSLHAVLGKILEEAGPEEALETSQALTRLGFEAAKRAGASMNPFLGESLDLPPRPEGDDTEQWRAYADEVEGWLQDHSEFEDDDFGPLNLLWKSGARTNVHQLRQYIGGTGLIRGVDNELMPQRHGWVEGLTCDEMTARVNGARWGLANMLAEVAEVDHDLKERSVPGGYNVLVRARRAKKPGVVFARAAYKGEGDPLADVYSRLFVGLPAQDE